MSREALFEVADQIDTLSSWLDERHERIEIWRAEKQVQAPGPGVSEVLDLLGAARSALDLCRPALVLFEARLPSVPPSRTDKVS